MNKLLLLTFGVLSCGALARADAPVVAPLTVPEAAADASAVWAGVTGGKMTAAQAWQDGLLDASTVQEGLAQGVASGQDEKAMQLRRELGGLLVNNAPAVAAAGATLPRGVQLALADYYASVGDERAAPLYEAVIAQTKAPYERGLRFLALGRFWSDQKQAPKAQEIFGRGRAVLLAEDKNPQLAAEMLLRTAQAWEQAGDSDKARQFYLQTALSPDASMASGAIMEGFRRELRLNPQIAEAQLLQLEKEVKNPNARLTTQFLLSWARYNAGEWDAFLLQAEQVLTQYETLERRSQRQAFAPLALQLEDGRKWAKLWQTNTIVAEQPDLDLRFDGPLQQSVERRIFVNTAKPTPLQVTVEGDTNRVSARIEASPWAPELAQVRHQQIVVVTLTSGVGKASSTLRIESAVKNGELLRLLVNVSSQTTEVKIQ